MISFASRSKTLLVAGIAYAFASSFSTTQAQVTAAPPAQTQDSNASETYLWQRDIDYYQGIDSALTAESDPDARCRLHLYRPAAPGFATIVWFHAGGLTSGSPTVPEGLLEQNVAVVTVGYRFSPQVSAPAYIQDAAAAVAWTRQHIADFGGDPEKIVISGHSAGGYLTSMLALDERWLGEHELSPNAFAGYIPLSGHAITHFTIRAERGIDGTQPIVDDLAPLYHVRADAPPLILITGDRDLEMLGRYEENAYLWRMMQVAGHTETELFELEGYDHGSMVAGAMPLLLRHTETLTRD